MRLLESTKWADKNVTAAKDVSNLCTANQGTAVSTSYYSLTIKCNNPQLSVNVYRESMSSEICDRGLVFLKMVKSNGLTRFSHETNPIKKSAKSC